MAGEDLSLDGGQVQRLWDLLVVIRVPAAESQRVNPAGRAQTETSRVPTLVNLLFLWGEVQEGGGQSLSGRICKRRQGSEGRCERERPARTLSENAEAPTSEVRGDNPSFF